VDSLYEKPNSSKPGVRDHWYPGEVKQIPEFFMISFQCADLDFVFFFQLKEDTPSRLQAFSQNKLFFFHQTIKHDY